jgi:hypothetical protein
LGDQDMAPRTQPGPSALARRHRVAKGHCQVNKKSLPNAFPLRKAERVGIAKIQGLVKAQNPL